MTGQGRAVSGRLNYLELPASDTATSARFYTAAFGWDFTPFGPTYAATIGNGCDAGLQGDAVEASLAPLPVVQVDDLESALAAVEAAGGVICKPPFAYPGGRRFHFRDPSGNELAVYVVDPA